MAINPQVRERILAQLGPDHAQAYPRHLEQSYPHVLEKIAVASTPVELERTFEDLMLTQRAGRQGFPMEIFDELLKLVAVYRKLNLLREPPRKDGDIWNWVSEIGYDPNAHHAG